MQTPPDARPARFSTTDLTPPPRRWHDARTKLRDFAILTYTVDPAALAAHLPRSLEPDVYTLDDGRQVAFVSAVMFQDEGFHFRGAPFYREDMGQTNFRAYVRCRGQRAVWFFGTSLGSPMVSVPRYLWGLPWHRADMRFNTEWDGYHCRYYGHRARSSWASVSLEMSGLDVPMGRLDGFADEEETRVVLTHPLVGYYYRRGGRLGSYGVWHVPLNLWMMDVHEARVPLFERLGLITADQAPHSALAMPLTEFVIHLPPTRHPVVPSGYLRRVRTRRDLLGW